MLSFLQFVSLMEDWDDKPAMKGWMSPSGNAHMFSHHSEHRHNHHPEYIKQGGKHGDSLEHAQAKGFVRFGANANSFHGQHHFVHYDDTHPKGRDTALKALQYMRPKHNDEVAVSGRGGLFKNGKANRTTMSQLGRDAVVPASKAAELIRAGKNTKPVVRKPVQPVQRKEMTPDERKAWLDKIKDHMPKGMRMESVDSAKLKRAAFHNDAYHILDSHEGTKGGTSAAGGCGVLAHALHKHMPGSKLVDIHNKDTGHTEHVGVHHGDHVYDAYGAHPAKHFVSRFQKREGVHGNLEMTDHHPERTAKSDISTHPGTVAKMHAHLTKHL